MDQISRALLGTGGGAAAADAVYVEDVFSTYLYTGNGSTQTINNGIALGSGSSDNVSLHLTGDSLTDSSAVPSTLTIEGNTQVSTSVKKYGTGSIYFDGSGDRIVVPSASKLNLDGDFTIEMWLYVTSVSTAYQVLFDTSSSGTAGSTMTELWVEAPGKIGYYARGAYVLLGATTLSANTWYHVALTKQGSTQRLFINGVVDATATSSTQPNDSYNWYIGDRVSGAGSAQYPLQGYIDDFRVTKGVARYTANFTPPTAALPLDTLMTGKGGLVWMKDRVGASKWHQLFDTARGGQDSLASNVTDVSYNLGGYPTRGVQFNANGFSFKDIFNVGIDGNAGVSWTFRKQAKFFDVVTYTGNNASNRAISHNLGSTPGFILVKATSTTGEWYALHRVGNSGSWGVGTLNSTNAFVAPNPSFWGNGTTFTAPTSTTFTVSADGGSLTNGSGITFVAYLFAHNAGGFGATGTDNVISCGSFTDNGAIQSINLGYEPQWVLAKRTNITGDWWLVDNMRGMPVGSVDATLKPNAADAEQNVYEFINPEATGFRWQSGSISSSGQTWIYIAIRRGPMRPPTSGTSVFGLTLKTSYGANEIVSTSFAPDMSINKATTLVIDNYLPSRLTGGYMITNTTAAEVAGLWKWDGPAGQSYATISYTGTPIYWSFRRAPGFFDVVCYTGTGSATTFNHNLTVVPELMIVKCRDSAGGWIVYFSGWGDGRRLVLQSSSALISADSSIWNNTEPTSTQFTVGTSLSTGSATYVNYLFASVTGVSKVGTYTGNGSSQTINCGFAAGARFVMIKRTDNTGDWYVWDTARGIVSANDPHLSLNSTAAEVTTNDSVDPDNTGFIVNQVAATNVNVNNATYLYLAIA